MGSYSLRVFGDHQANQKILTEVFYLKLLSLNSAAWQCSEQCDKVNCFLVIFQRYENYYWEIFYETNLLIPLQRPVVIAYDSFRPCSDTFTLTLGRTALFGETNMNKSSLLLC